MVERTPFFNLLNFSLSIFSFNGNGKAFYFKYSNVYELAVCMNLFTAEIHILSKGIKLGKNIRHLFWI